MKAITKAVSNFLNKFEELIEATKSYQQALAELTPLYNKAKPAEQIEIRNSVATLIGMKYGVVPKVMEQGANKGLLGFDAHGTQAEQQARDILRKGFPTSSKSVGQNPTVRKASKVTPVDRIKARVTKFVKQAKKSEIQERLDELAIELKLLKQFV
jgi:hypothetical protein